jgi:hypothetical protein
MGEGGRIDSVGLATVGEADVEIDNGAFDITESDEDDTKVGKPMGGLVATGEDLD